MIRTVIEPRVIKTWGDFVDQSPSFSIALDGYVSGPPRFDLEGPRANFNHHEGVDRISTSSTSGQAHIYVKQGLFRKFRRDGTPEATLFLNDPDQDSALAWWLLTNHDRFSGQRSEPLLSRLVFAEDMLDRTAGAYPFPIDSELMMDVAWIFEPYTSQVQRVSEMGPNDMNAVIESIGARVDKYLMNKGERIEPDARYDLIHQGTYRGDSWAMIREIGSFAKSKLFNSGTFGYIVYKGEMLSGSHVYALGRMSPLIGFPVSELMAHYNEVEGVDDGDPDRWGGGDGVGGSPRKRGSKIQPGQLAAVTADFLGSKEE